MATDSDNGQAAGGGAALAPGVMAEPLPLGETLLMNVHTLAYFGLDALGTRLWQALQETGDAGAAARRVARETGKSPEQLRATLQTLLDTMERGGLIRRHAP